MMLRSIPQFRILEDLPLHRECIVGTLSKGHCLDPNSMQNYGPKPLRLAQKTIVLHTFGVQVGFNIASYRASETQDLAIIGVVFLGSP